MTSSKRNPEQIGRILMRLGVGLCADCGGPVEPVEGLPGTQHWFLPFRCKACLDKRQKEWEKEDER